MRKEAIILIAILAVVIVGLVIGSKYYREGTAQPVKTDNKAQETLVRPDSPSIGPVDAKVTVVEFLDPECESCAAFAPVIKKLQKEFANDMRLVIRYAPFHKNARVAALYTEAAGRQGKYWEMQEKLFSKQSEWGEVHGHGTPAGPPPDPRPKFEKYAEELGLNVDQLKAAAEDPELAAKIDRDMQDVQTMGVRSTPTIYVNGRKLQRLTEADLRQLISSEINK